MVTFLRFLQSQSESELPQKVQARILPSFLAMAKRNGYDDFSEASLRAWVVELLANGMKPAGVRRYVTGLYSVYKMWQNEYPKDDPFGSVLIDLGTITESPRAVLNKNLGCVKRLLKNSSVDEGCTVAVFFLLLYDTELSLNSLIRLEKEKYDVGCPQIEDILDAEERKSNGIKYVFKFRRGDFTDRSIERGITADIRRLLESAGMNLGDTFSADYIRSLWITAALKCGIDVTTIRNMVRSVPVEYGCLSLLQPSEIDRVGRQRIMRKVANCINDTTERWYIMNMRHKETPESIKEAIHKYNKRILERLLFYNPTYKFVKKDKRGKKTIEERSYLPGILFCKMRSDKVSSLINGIRDVAWCYRWSKSPNSSYSYLTQSQMKAFQRHIGQLSPDIRMEIEQRETPLACDTDVMISGGELDGRIGRITSVRNTDGTRTYTLEITENVAAKWTVRDIDEALLTPVDKKH